MFYSQAIRQIESNTYKDILLIPQLWSSCPNSYPQKLWRTPQRKLKV